MGWCSCSCQLAAQAKYAPKLRTGHYLQTQSPVQCSCSLHGCVDQELPAAAETMDGVVGWWSGRQNEIAFFAVRVRSFILQPARPSSQHTLHSDATHKLRCVCVAQAQARPAVQFSRFGRKNAYACTTKTHRPPQFGVVAQWPERVR